MIIVNESVTQSVSESISRSIKCQLCHLFNEFFDKLASNDDIILRHNKKNSNLTHNRPNE